LKLVLIDFNMLSKIIPKGMTSRANVPFGGAGFVGQVRRFAASHDHFYDLI
jgi:isovaleryl-CoA dehydrogenase